MLDLIISIIGIMLIYKAYETSGFGKALIIRIILYIITLLLEGGTFFKLPINLMLTVAAIKIVQLLILNFIEYKIFENTRTFFTYIVLAIIIEFLSMIALSYLMMTFMFPL